MNSNAQESATLLSIIRLAARQWKYKAVMVAAGAGYWVLYAISGGMFFYYSFDLGPILKADNIPNPYFLLYTRGIADFYDSGMIWYPTNHLQVNLLFGPVFFSIVLSVLFGLNMLLLAFGFRYRRSKSGRGLGGIMGVIPALFSQGCCSVPFATVLFSSFIPATLLYTVYEFVIPMNIIFASLMLLALVYGARRLGSCCAPG